MRQWRRSCTVSNGEVVACHRVLSVVVADNVALWTFDGSIATTVEPTDFIIDGSTGGGFGVVAGSTVQIFYDSITSDPAPWSIVGTDGITFDDGHPLCASQSGTTGL